MDKKRVGEAQALKVLWAGLVGDAVAGEQVHPRFGDGEAGGGDRDELAVVVASAHLEGDGWVGAHLELGAPLMGQGNMSDGAAGHVAEGPELAQGVLGELSKTADAVLFDGGRGGGEVASAGDLALSARGRAKRAELDFEGEGAGGERDLQGALVGIGEFAGSVAWALGQNSRSIPRELDCAGAIGHAAGGLAGIGSQLNPREGATQGVGGDDLQGLQRGGLVQALGRAWG